jgi:LmbE family N-acetylglucosaminyl deacetylase
MLHILTRPSAASGRAPPADSAAVLDALRWGDAIEAPACVVVAHPDDETLGLGARLAGFERLTLVHLTDGAPEDPADARQAGFPDASAYRRARWAELDRALEILGVAPRWRALGIRDQTAARRLPSLIRTLTPILARHALVLTHSYEGGHPDHDAAAFAVQTGCTALAASGRRVPARLEFAGYHLDRGRTVTGVFWPDPSRPPVAAQLTLGQRERKQQALAAFESQAGTLRWFAAETEAYREAPVYDFTRPPPPGAALYDRWGLAIISAEWRGLAAAALEQLGAAA